MYLYIYRTLFLKVYTSSKNVPILWKIVVRIVHLHVDKLAWNVGAVNGKWKIIP